MWNTSTGAQCWAPRPTQPCAPDCPPIETQPGVSIRPNRGSMLGRRAPLSRAPQPTPQPTIRRWERRSLNLAPRWGSTSPRELSPFTGLVHVAKAGFAPPVGEGGGCRVDPHRAFGAPAPQFVDIVGFFVRAGLQRCVPSLPGFGYCAWDVWGWLPGLPVR